MSLSTQPYKGSRDFYPEDKRLQKWMFKNWREVVEQYGYEEYDAPLIESIELYAAKTGDEIVNEQTYSFEDRGGRKVTIRPEMTPTVSRMVAARRQELSYPARLYSIPNLWRYERPQRGRLREHWQLNVDLFGVDSIQAELEMIDIVDALMRKFGASKNMYSIRINSRKLMNHILDSFLGLKKPNGHDLSKLIDRMHKLTPEEFSKQLKSIVNDKQAKQVTDLLQAKQLSDLPDSVQSCASAKALAGFIKSLHERGITNAIFDVSLMRGFDYYSDIVFEVFDTDKENNRSLFGGGRYDGLVGLFGAEPIATIGFGVGDVTFENFLRSHKLIDQIEPTTDLTVLLQTDDPEIAAPAISKLRSNGLNVSVDYSGRKLDKQLKAAVKSGVVHALVIGSDELASGSYSLKNLTDTSQQTVTLDQVAAIITQLRSE